MRYFGNAVLVLAYADVIIGRIGPRGIDDKFMKDAAQTLQSGNAALFLLIPKMTTDKVLAELHGVGGTVLRTSFDHTKEEALRAALAATRQAIRRPEGRTETARAAVVT